MTKIKVVLAVLLLILVGAQVSFSAVKKVKAQTKAKKAVVKEETKCPVTGRKVNPATATLKTVYKGKPYYFCCAGCPEEFNKNPGKYAK